MENAPYTPSKKTKEQRRTAARKSGANAANADVMDESFLAATFEPFLEIAKDPNAAFHTILKELQAGNRSTYDEIEAALLMLMGVNIHALAVGRAVASKDDHLTINLHLVALEKIQCILRSFVLSRGKSKPKSPKRAKTAMQKKTLGKHAEKTMVN